MHALGRPVNAAGACGGRGPGAGATPDPEDADVVGFVLGDRGDFVSFGDSDFPFDKITLVLLARCVDPDRDLVLRGGDASTVATNSFEPVSLMVRSTHSAGAAAFPKVAVEVFVASLDIARARGTDPYQSQSVGGLRLITCRLGGIWG